MITKAILPRSANQFLFIVIILAIFSAFDFARASQTAGESLIRTILEPDMFPTSWKEEKADALKDQSVVKQARKIVEAELEKYPPSLIKNYLQRIYIVDTLYRGTIKMGGTNSNRNIYIEGKNPEQFHCSISRVLHAEFSSILLRKNSGMLSLADWNAINPAGFKYFGKGGTQALRAGVGSSKDYSLEEIKKNGGAFLSQYAQADLEDDFNSVVKRLFTGNKLLWLAYAKSDLKIKAKVDMVIKFYNSIDEHFDYDFFKKIPECR